MANSKILNCNYDVINPAIISSDNCRIIDENGKEYIDFESGIWCVPLGHGNKQINDAMIKQINHISHIGYRYSAKIVEEAAEKVLALLNFDGGKCVFLTSGSEAVEFGIQLAKKIMKGQYFLCLENYFLSSYGVAANRNKDSWISLDLSEYNGNPDDFLKDVAFEKIGAFVFEPGSASGLVKLPPKELIKAIERKIKQNGGIFIVNEVTTGVGRTGKWFGFEHYDICPDIVSMGKGIGNGYPVSVIALSKRVSDSAEKSEFRYSQSHQNDPLGCAVVKEVITVIENNHYIKRSAEISIILEHELKALQKKHKCIKDVRGVGLMFAIEFYNDENFPLERIHRELFDAGYITGFLARANLFRFDPAITIEAEQIKKMIEALSTILYKKGLPR
ncbi:MAG: aspartate aminotransferase family protein [Defluviitaleaceae bacterium]|nr:aspartate aminotransferase family protein [Defluviitaleaceae bacterium]